MHLTVNSELHVVTEASRIGILGLGFETRNLLRRGGQTPNL